MAWEIGVGALSKALLLGAGGLSARLVAQTGLSGASGGQKPPLAVAEAVPRAALPREVLAHLALPPDQERACRSIGMPEDGSRIYNGKLRAPDTPAEAAQKFVVWARAVDELGPFTAKQAEARYTEFCEVDHRTPVPSNLFLGALKLHPEVRKNQVGSRWRYIIKPAPVVLPAPKKAKAKPAKRPSAMHTARKPARVA
jgi:hypothetical protein